MLGYLMVGIFLGAWVLSVLVWKFGHYGAAQGQGSFVHTHEHAHEDVAHTHEHLH